MILVIDIGNTHVSVAGVADNEILFTGKTDTNPAWDGGEYTRRLRPLLSGRVCRGAIVSSVVPQITDAVLDAAEALLGKRPMLVTAQTRTGLTVALAQPEKIGRDRLADSAWAAEYFPLPAVTADLGTATTLNVILPGKVFAGGMICAGVQTMLHALADRTAQLPRLEVEAPESLIGRNTDECMLSGAVFGTAAMVDGLVQRVEEALGTPVTLLLTGGGGRYVTCHLHHKHIFDPDMTRKGLALLYRLNEEEH